MPNYAGWLNSDANAMRDAKSDSGQILTLNVINDQKTVPWKGLTVRKDLLDQLGLSIPETYDDWETVLTGFRDLGVKRPLFIANDGSTDQNFETGYGIGMRLYHDGKTVKYGPYEPGYRDYLEMMSKWYAEGLIDQDFTGTTGINGFIGFPPDDIINRAEVGGGVMPSSALGSMRYDMGVADVNFFYSGVSAPVKNRGDKVNFSISAGSGLVAAAMAINAEFDLEKIPTLLTYFDYLYSEEGSILANFGIEGESYKIGADGKPHYTDIIDSGAWDGVNLFHVYNYAFLTFPHLSQDKERIQTRPDGIIELQEKWIRTGDDFGVLPQVTLTKEEIDIAMSKLNDINTYASEMSANIITGAKPLSAYDTFITEVEKMNIADMLSAYQAAYDRYNSR